MKVKELINELKKLPSDAKIYIAMDGEGNGYGLLNKDCIESDEKIVVLYPGYPQVDEL